MSAPVFLPRGAMPASARSTSSDGIGSAEPVRRPLPARRDATLDDDGVDLVRLACQALRYRWFFAAAAVVALVVGLLVALAQPPRYKASTLLEIEVPPAKVFRQIEAVAVDTGMRAFLTAREKILSRTLAERVVADLELSQNSAFVFPPPRLALSNLAANVLAGPLVGTPGDIDASERRERAVEAVERNLSADLLANTSLITVAYESADPAMARDVANAAADRFIASRVEETSRLSATARRFVEEQAGQAKERLETAERELVAYAKRAGITGDGDTSPLILRTVTDLNDALTEAVRKRLDAARQVRQIEAGHGADMPQVLESEALQDIREKLVELQGRYGLKRATFKPDYPEMRALASQIRELRRQERGTLAAISESIRLDYEDADARVRELRAKLAETKAAESDYRDRSIRYTILKREVASNRAQYESLVAKRNELGVGAELRSGNVRVVDRAIAPDEAIGPSIPVHLAMSLAIFMGLAAGIVYVRETTADTFASPFQIEDALAIPVLGAIPDVALDRLPEALNDRRSRLSEAHRSLRTALLSATGERLPKSILVTSAHAGEGKSTTVYKLSETLAALGARVVVVDADLRKPDLHDRFGVTNETGLADLLAELSTPDEMRRMFKYTRIANVKLLTAGALPPSPADLLSCERMQQLMRLLGERFDVVVVDAPPLVGLSDAAILGRLAEATLLVVSADNVPRRAAQVSLDRLTAAGANVVGAAMTRLAARRFGATYAGDYVSSGRDGDSVYGAIPISIAADGRREPAFGF